MEAVIACGIQKAYFNKSGTRYLGEKAEILKVRLVSYLSSLDRKQIATFMVREVHQPDDKFYLRTKSHSLVGTPDIEIPEVFKPHIKMVINTTRPGALYATPLESELNKIKPSRIYIVGVETHTNVLFTAEELRNRGYDVKAFEALMTSEDDYLHALGITLLANTLSVRID
ncbi:MAG: isochorismatase family protein [Candidatus Altiarchaeales archaeon]|nr:isochorismatase family protein [Candidatus Altiarchaeales archaeon]